MNYSQEERLDIGRKLYSGEITRGEAAAMYGISIGTARGYMRLYRDINFLPPKNSHHKNLQLPPAQSSVTPESWEDYKKLSKEEILLELIKTKINEARVKKGYMVRGSGSAKEFFCQTARISNNRRTFTAVPSKSAMQGGRCSKKQLLQLESNTVKSISARKSTYQEY